MWWCCVPLRVYTYSVYAQWYHLVSQGTTLYQSIASGITWWWYPHTVCVHTAWDGVHPGALDITTQQHV
jgi:hypothetical protein